MSNKELLLFGEASSRQTATLLWNVEYHRLFLHRLDELEHHLNDEERRRISDMLGEVKWGDRELEEVKRLLENAVWFSKLKRAAGKRAKTTIRRKRNGG